MKRLGFRAKLAEGQFALREMTVALRDRRVWALILGAALLVGLAGPFHTMDSLHLPGRIAYWMAVGVPAALLMWALNGLVAAACPPRWPDAAVAGLAGVLGVLPVTALVAVSMWLAGLDMPEAGFAGLFPYVAPTVIGISVLIAVLPGGAAAPAAAATPAATGLFARLPADMGRDIIAVQAQDHYVNVSTTQGSRLILMRMSDATEDLAGLSGMQIHRSWWVNLKHVSALEKSETGGMKLALRNGLSVPVPRSRLSEVKRALAARQPGAAGAG